ncbi:MAG: hypothetical protein JNK38_04355 [Acidobacteria bacterium]|nr:hypothetical protein [Acidobacteriota bacterium]
MPNLFGEKENVIMDEQTKSFPFEPDPVVEFFKQCIDPTVLEENLKLTIEERFEKAKRLQILSEAFRESGQKCSEASIF